MDFRPLIQESLQLLSCVCLNPFSENLINRIIAICSASVVVIVLIDVVLILGFTYQGADSTMEVLTVIAMSQIFIKMLFFLSYKRQIIMLIKNTSMFWKPNLGDSQQQIENEKIFSFVRSCIRSYVVLLMLICLLYFIRPLFVTEVIALPWKSCFSQIFSYRVCYVLEVLEAVILVLIQVGFDTLYIALIANIICEFKLIENRFSDLKINPIVRGTDKETMDELNKLIDHHTLILECTKITKHVYRFPLLGLFLSNMFGMCFSMIIMTNTNTDSSAKIQFAMMTMFYLMELFFYCISGSVIADESVKIAYEVYKSKWWIKTQPELRKALIMVILRSNKAEILTAGGLLQVNLQTFTMILRSSASFITFVQVIYGNT